MGKHRHKKSFYDVDEDDLSSIHKHHRQHRCQHSSDKHDEIKQRLPSISSFDNSKIDYDETALQSPPTKRHRSTSNSSQSPSKILSQLIENPEFLANAGPKAKEFAETARQLLSKPDLDPTTQQIICAMTQAAVNVGKRLGSSSSSTPVDQCVDEISVTTSTTYSSSALLSPTLSNTSSSSTSTTPQQQFHAIISSEENKTSVEPESDEDILIKQMIERAIKLTRQGDMRHAQHLLGIIHEKLSNKQKRAAETATVTISNSNDNEKVKIPSSTEFHSFSSISHDNSQGGNYYHNMNKISPNGSEQSNDYQNTPSYPHPPPPPPSPPPPPPPLPDMDPTALPSIPVPLIEQVQELLSNPSEVQDILKKLFGVNENQRISPPEEYQQQSHLSSSSTYHYQPVPMSYNNSLLYPSSSRLNTTTQLTRASPLPPPPNEPQPYNSSLAFMQGNRRNLPPLQTTERCFSSSTNKNKTIQPSLTLPSTQSNRSFSYGSLSNNNGIMSLVPNTPQSLLSAPPLMKVNPTFSFGSSTSAPLEPVVTRWSNHNEQQRGLHPFWCATCALGFPHQVAYQDHLRNHIPCTIPGCSYAATEQLVRIHHMNIHENNGRNRLNNPIFHQTRSNLHQQQKPLEQPWPLMRM